MTSNQQHQPNQNQQPQSIRARRGDYSEDIDWFLNSAPSAVGEHGTLSSTVNALERGSPCAGGIPNTDLYTDGQVGLSEDRFGNRREVEGDIAKSRRLAIVWAALSPITQRTLAEHYLYHKRTEFKRQNGVVEYDKFPEFVDARLGDLSAVALRMSMRNGCYAQLLQACADDQPVRIRRYLRAAARAVALAHRRWRAHPGSRRPTTKVFVAQHLGHDRERYLESVAAIRSILAGRIA